VSVAVTLVGATLDDQSVVLIPDGEFASLALPLVVAARLAGAEVRTAPFGSLADAVDRTVTLVATSHVRSNGGATQDLAALAGAARSVGAQVLVDASHSAGILPLAADRLQIDYVAAAAYKHLLCPRGVAFLHLGPETPMPPALTASWRGLRLESDFFTIDPDDLDESAAGLDVSLAWHPWAGARRSLELLDAIPATGRREWCVGLATKAAEALGLEPTGSSVLGVPTSDDPQTVKSMLAKRSIVAAVRAGEVRISFHVYNTEDHLEAAVEALGPLVRPP
jgi:selenocysteine lyase/cysteine desulfurase